MTYSATAATPSRQRVSERLQRLPIADAVSALSRFSSARSPADTYSKLRLFSSEGKLCFQARNNAGVAVVSTDLDADIDCLVDFNTFSGVINRISDGGIGLEVQGPRLRIVSEKSDVNIPIFDLITESIHPSFSLVTVSPAEWLECEGKMGIVGVETQIEYALGVRLYSEDGLYMLMSSNNGTCGAKMECQGDGIDACVPLESVRAVSAAIRRVGGDTLSLGYHNNWLYITSGTFQATIPTIGGRPPHKRSAWEKMRPSTVWHVNKSELMEGLKQAELFSETGASGVDIIPTDEGLRIIRDSRNDEGTVIMESPGECEYVIPGHYKGERLTIKLPALMQMLKNCGEEFTLYASDRSVCVESGRYFAGFACMKRGQ